MKAIQGTVVSTKTEKTAMVLVERVVIHPVYKKRYRRVKKYPVHDEIGVKVGQTVLFVASRPYSKLKRWKIVKVIEGTDSLARSKGKSKVKAVKSSQSRAARKGGGK